MRESGRCLERERHYLMRPLAALTSDKADTASVARAVGGADVIGVQGAAGLVRTHEIRLHVKGGHEKTAGPGTRNLPADDPL